MTVAPSAFSAPAPASGGGWRAAAILAAALASAALLLWLVRDPILAGAFLAGLLGFGLILLLASRGNRPAAEAAPANPDIALLRAAIDRASAAVAVTAADSGALVCANASYSEWFGGDVTPASLPEADRERLAVAAIEARRDGKAEIDRIALRGRSLRVSVEPAGIADRFLIWTLTPIRTADLAGDVKRLVGGEGGRRLGEAGVMTVLVDGQGDIVAANRAFRARAAGRADLSLAGGPLVGLIAAAENGSFHFASEGAAAAPLRLVQVAVGEASGTAALFLLLDDPGGGFGSLRREEGASVNALLDVLPLGLALINIDGRFLHLNKVFRRTAGVAKDARPAYPGDLVVDEDKAALSDAVRRFARGPANHGDMSLRLKARPDEPIVVTLAGIRGLGEAAVLLSMKDSSEEDRLKRQVAQATKMQAVGQLAGGVAHDFNNILTAIIGHCDLMLMRHTPGDSDYDDIQQIRGNSNRAANLTRQLLAFSRQQTLRPQVLQLPDVIAEVSNLLKRLLGETITLSIKHGRNLGAVRADPGQLEQVVVNLAVNARDAMLAKDPAAGGTLTIQTYAVSPEEVRRMGSEILPVGDYTALKVSDTGTGIPDGILGKIFEPFFTTKEVGKGTGLGLSTVYGIVKQSGGYIFAESEEGEGASFVVYLPVHRADAAAAPAPRAREKAGELWGTGTILLVEDEAMVRHVAERALTRHGYTVLSAENGEAGLEILDREDGVDLMISDVVMPTMDGPTTAREARKRHPELPILFISGYAEEHLRKSIDLDNVAFLAKPFSVQKLAEAVRDVLAAK